MAEFVIIGWKNSGSYKNSRMQGKGIKGLKREFLPTFRKDLSPK